MILIALGHALFHVYVFLVRSDVPNLIQVSSGFAAGYALRKFNCSKKGCPRIGKHAVKGTTFKTCSKHATVDDHADLTARHKLERPEQHRLLSGEHS
jgi:hypothetical protein